MSSYIQDTELRLAQQRYKKGQLEVVVVKLEPCACDEDPFIGQFQRLASRFKSIAQARLRFLAWDQVRKDLLPVIKKVRDRKTSLTVAA